MAFWFIGNNIKWLLWYPGQIKVQNSVGLFKLSIRSNYFCIDLRTLILIGLVRTHFALDFNGLSSYSRIWINHNNLFGFRISALGVFFRMCYFCKGSSFFLIVLNEKQLHHNNLSGLVLCCFQVVCDIKFC